MNVDRLPGWAQALGHLFPLFYANSVIQEVIRPAGAWQRQRGALAALGCYSVALLLLASRTLTEVE